MITSLYAGLLALWICRLIFGVVGARRSNKISLGDGGNPELIAARSAHSNAVETIPIFLILLYFFEVNVLPLGLLGVCLVHVFGLVFVVGRLLHAQAILSGTFKNRLLGMKITLTCLSGLAVVNMGFYFYRLFIG